MRELQGYALNQASITLLNVRNASSKVLKAVKVDYNEEEVVHMLHRITSSHCNGEAIAKYIVFNLFETGDSDHIAILVKMMQGINRTINYKVGDKVLVSTRDLPTWRFATDEQQIEQNLGKLNGSVLLMHAEIIAVEEYRTKPYKVQFRHIKEDKPTEIQTDTAWTTDEYISFEHNLNDFELIE